MFPNGYTRAQYHEAGIDDSTIEYRGFDRDPSTPSPLGEMFPNGYTRAQYHEAGIDDSTIEYWGFDRDPSAPSPLGAGEAIAEAMDEGWW